MTAVLAIEDSRLESNIPPAAQSDDWIIRQAIVLLERRIFRAGALLSAPADVCDYLRLKLTGEPNEIFAVIFLDSRHQVLSYEPLFHGTIDQTSVFPRVVVQRALATNAAAVILWRINIPPDVPSPAPRTVRSPRDSSPHWNWSTSGCWITSSSGTVGHIPLRKPACCRAESIPPSIPQCRPRMVCTGVLHDDRNAECRGIQLFVIASSRFGFD